MPPSAEGLAPRLLIGPALRTQSDRRLVRLVRDGYEQAFEEIVRRYGRPLGRYAATIVGGRSEDVTQDAFSKALLALRRTDAEIDLRPWLYRIVRNTALNDLRDRPPEAELAESMPASGDPAQALERREELVDLTRRLQALPDPQRAAIVMRELEGLGHDEIAAALGMSGGAARQAIYRARAALRDGLGMLVPMPLVRALLSEDLTRHAELATGAVGGAGAGVGVKPTAATLLVAGTVSAGVVLHEEPGPTDPVGTAAAAGTPQRIGPAASSSTGGRPGPAGHRNGTAGRSGDDSSGRGSNRRGHEDGPAGAFDGNDAGGHDHRSGEGPSDRSGRDGGGSADHVSSGGDRSGHDGSDSSEASRSGESSGDDSSSGSGEALESSSEGSGSDGPSDSADGGSSDDSSADGTGSSPEESGSTLDGSSGESRDSSGASGLIEEMSPIN